MHRGNGSMRPTTRTRYGRSYGWMMRYFHGTLAILRIAERTWGIDTSAARQAVELVMRRITREWGRLR